MDSVFIHRLMTSIWYSGRWFGTVVIFPYIGNVIIPIYELIFFQRGWVHPPTSISLYMYVSTVAEYLPSTTCRWFIPSIYGQLGIVWLGTSGLSDRWFNHLCRWIDAMDTYVLWVFLFWTWANESRGALTMLPATMFRESASQTSPWGDDSLTMSGWRR